MFWGEGPDLQTAFLLLKLLFASYKQVLKCSRKGDEYYNGDGSFTSSSNWQNRYFQGLFKSTFIHSYLRHFVAATKYIKTSLKIKLDLYYGTHKEHLLF